MLSSIRFQNFNNLSQTSFNLINNLLLSSMDLWFKINELFFNFMQLSKHWWKWVFFCQNRSSSIFSEIVKHQSFIKLDSILSHSSYWHLGYWKWKNNFEISFDFSQSLSTKPENFFESFNLCFSIFFNNSFKYRWGLR